MIVLIPAYQPDERLLALVRSVREADAGLRVLVVDDGSGSAYRRIVGAARALGCIVIGHLPNRGKGYALKAGFRYVAEHFPGEDVVCADCDGQHSVVDILRVAERVRGSRTAMVLGSRRFTGDVPWRSRLGNEVTRQLFHLATGLRLHDTQTGLRGYPAPMLGWLRTVGGNRFEYELTLLLRAGEAGYAVEEVEITTIYLEGNVSSHFRPVVDSARIYAPLLRFGLSSLTAFAIDAAALLALHAVTGSLLASVVGARVVSSAVNFLVNRRWVFDRGRRAPLRGAAARYYALVIALLAANYGLLSALTGLGVALLPAKVLTEAALFCVSYLAQRRLVFARQRAAGQAAASRGDHEPATAEIAPPVSEALARIVHMFDVVTEVPATPVWRESSTIVRRRLAALRSGAPAFAPPSGPDAGGRRQSLGPAERTVVRCTDDVPEGVHVRHGLASGHGSAPHTVTASGPVAPVDTAATSGTVITPTAAATSGAVATPDAVAAPDIVTPPGAVATHGFAASTRGLDAATPAPDDEAVQRDMEEALGLTPPGVELTAMAQAVAVDTADDRVLIEALGAWDRVISWATAQQAAAIQELATRRTATSSVQDDFLADEVALALRRTRRAADLVMDLAAGLHRYPAVHQALSEGYLDVRTAQVIIDETDALPHGADDDRADDDSADDDRAVVTEFVAGALRYAQSPGITPPRMRAHLRRRALSIDPAATARRARAEAERRGVVMVTAPDAMARLIAYLPAADAMTAYTAVDAMAGAQAPSDGRSRDQRRADAFTDLFRTVLDTGRVPCSAPGQTPGTASRTESGQHAATGQPAVIGEHSGAAQRCATGEDPGGAAAPAGLAFRPLPSPQRRRPHLQLTMAATTVLGLDRRPGELAGYGPIPAEMARMLATDATWRRLLTDPATGAITDRSATAYRPGTVLAAAVIDRDRTCTFPGCRVPAWRCDLDHLVPYRPDQPATGQTTADNLHALCRHHHRLKTHGDWLVHRDLSTGTTWWTTPAGHRYARPPELVEVPPRRTRPPSTPADPPMPPAVRPPPEAPRPPWPPGPADDPPF